MLVYPDLPAARRLALSVRQGRFRDQGRLTRGPLGLGTDFESIRDYSPDDDARQINWRATDRLGRPMSNQFRVEQDREVMLLIDAGRLMGAPLEDRTRLDAAVDAAVTVALVADVVGDRCGVVAFDDGIRRRLPPRRAGGDAVVRALFDLEPRARRRRLRARLPDRRGRQALADRRLLRPARGGGGAAARRRGAGARAPPRRARRLGARPRPRPPARHRARRRRSTSTARRSRSTCSRRAPAWRTGSSARGRACSRRPRAGCPPRACAPTFRPRPAPGSERPRHATSPQNTTPSPSPTASAPPRPPVEPLTKPSTSPASTTQGIVPSTSSIAGRASRRSDWPRVSVPGSTSAQPIRSPAAAAIAMHDSSSTPCGRTNSKKPALEPFSIERPRIAPMKPPLKISTAAVPSPAKMPPAIERNVTRMLFVKITLDSAAWSPALAAFPRPPGSAAPWNSRGHDADRRGRVVDRPHRGQRERGEQQHQRGDQRPRALEHPAPVAGRQEPPQRAARALVGVDGLAARRARAARAAA